jgi:DNA-binding beta-propeller fold protein YncE
MDRRVLWVGRAVMTTVVSAWAAAGCSNSSPTDTHAPAILVVSPDSIALMRYDSVRLMVSVLDRDSALVSGAAVTFRSSNNAIATVSATGEVHSAGPVGKTGIVVTSGSANRTIPITVATTPSAVHVAPADTVIRQGKTYMLRAVVVDSFGDSVANAPRSYASNDTAIATVSANGLVLGKKPGVTSLLVHAGAFTTGATVSVVDTNVIARILLANAPYGVAASSAGVVYVAPIIGSAVRRVNMTTFALSDSIPVAGDPAQVAFAGTATALVTRRAGSLVSVINVATHAQTDSIAVPGSPYPIRVSNDGATAYVTGGSTWLYKIDIAARSRVDSISIPGPALQLALGPGDSLVFVSSETNGTVTEIRASTMALVHTFATGGTPQGIAVSSDGSEVYIADEVGPLHIWSPASATEIDSIPAITGSFGIALSSDGTKLFVGTVGGSVYLVNRVTRAIIHSVPVGGTPRTIAVDPVTGYAIVPNEGGNWIDIVK